MNRNSGSCWIITDDSKFISSESEKGEKIFKELMAENFFYLVKKEATYSRNSGITNRINSMKSTHQDTS